MTAVLFVVLTVGAIGLWGAAIEKRRTKEAVKR